jgi:hypothetical protein
VADFEKEGLALSGLTPSAWAGLFEETRVAWRREAAARETVVRIADHQRRADYAFHSDGEPCMRWTDVRGVALSPRDAGGFLKPEALINGLKDQWATVDEEGTRHLVELYYNQRGEHDGYVVLYDWAEKGIFGTVGTHYHAFGSDLAAAQQEFSKQVRALGGRA